MMKRRFVWMGVLFLVTVSFLTLSSPLSAQEKVIKLRYSNLFPPMHPNAKLSEEWCKEIEKRTTGRVTFAYFPGNTLTPPTQTYDSVVKGIADVGQSLMAYSAGRFPLTGVLGLPLGFTSGDQATKTLNEFYKKFQPKEYADTKVMYFHGHGPGLISTKKVLNSIDDIKALRIKVNAENADIITAGRCPGHHAHHRNLRCPAERPAGRRAAALRGPEGLEVRRDRQDHDRQPQHVLHSADLRRHEQG